MPSIISARAVGKEYRVVEQPGAYHTLRDSIMRALSSPFRRAAAHHTRAFWALRHVDLDVVPGEIVGIIGGNGAGKSTLLKILARITRPTEGEVDLYGRVGSLLEVGTGFHSELSGRDNIFLSGAVLGMRRAEIKRKFDEIVAFAEVAAFLDTPVKHYSSGMHMRLAFSVAAHLEPEILIVDEVLAVGDAQFQRKCLGKMGEAAREGRTILFVSHNMGAIRSLCTRVLLLETGRIAIDGGVEECIERYLTRVTEPGTNEVDVSALHHRHGYGGFRFTRVALTAPEDRAVLTARRGIRLRCEATIELPLHDIEVSAAIDTPEGIRICECSSAPRLRISGVEPGEYSLECEIDAALLNPGRYVLGLSSRSGQRILDEVPSALSFEIVRALDSVPERVTPDRGLVRVEASWTTPVRIARREAFQQAR